MRSEAGNSSSNPFATQNFIDINQIHSNNSRHDISQLNR